MATVTVTIKRWIPGGWDLIPAAGPLAAAVAFGAMLYGLLVPVNELVRFAINLVYWPFFAFIALIVDVGLTAAFRAQDPSRWEMFRNGFFPLLLLVGIPVLYFAGNWFWLIVFCQCLHLVSSPPDDEQYREGCLSAVIMFVLLVVLGLIGAFGGHAAINSAFNFPNTTGDLRDLPGLLVMGIGFYIVLAVVSVYKEVLIREFNLLDD